MASTVDPNMFRQMSSGSMSRQTSAGRRKLMGGGHKKWLVRCPSRSDMRRAERDLRRAASLGFDADGHRIEGQDHEPVTFTKQVSAPEEGYAATKGMRRPGSRDGLRRSGSGSAERRRNSRGPEAEKGGYASGGYAPTSIANSKYRTASADRREEDNLKNRVVEI
eukprot:TRINITY_DN79211_c0_g1_i1.p1 TRINITY_DN79211_c0_g1~~TRINITY_DN79211_c0_g1_i1.p1  ORF type:complete len:165 (+),score=20.27 TRINITY_DN79211_c0_g1_i1:78-572(+)